MRLSVQLYTVRDAMDANAQSTLETIRSIGFEYVEIAGNYGATTAAEGKKLLDDLGLKVSGSHVGLDLMKNDLDKVIDTHLTLGCPFVIVPWLSEETYSAGWDTVAKQLEPIGEKLKAAGLSLAYHNHDFEFKTTDGKLGLDLFYETVSEDLLKAELDLAWVKIGGQDPASYIRKIGPRTRVVHLKDFDPTKTPQWTPAGQGTMDWDSCLAAAKEVGAEFGVVELDESPGDPLDAVRQSFEYFTSKGLA